MRCQEQFVSSLEEAFQSVKAINAEESMRFMLGRVCDHAGTNQQRIPARMTLLDTRRASSVLVLSSRLAEAMACRQLF